MISGNSLKKFCLSILLLTSYTVHSQGLKPLEDWQLAKNNDSIRVYVRRIQADSSRVEHQLRVVMDMHADLWAVVATLRDQKHLKDWINRAVECYNFDIIDDFHWHNYIEFNIPWPLNNQDIVTKNTMHQDSVTKIVRLEIVDDNNKLPPRKGVDRIPSFEGTWTITPIKGGRVHMEYTVYAGQKPWLPWWVISPFVEYGVWKTLHDMRDRVAEKYKSGVRVSYIEDE